jgi:hypothetical protein
MVQGSVTCRIAALPRSYVRDRVDEGRLVIDQVAIDAD